MRKVPQPKVKLWRLYAKPPGASRFRAMDYLNGVPVANLIHATIFTSRERALIDAQGIPLNTDWKWQWRLVTYRKCGTSTATEGGTNET